MFLALHYSYDAESTQILCWELVSKRGGQWLLHYAKSAYAETDVPDQVSELLAQRRRWVNGTLFSTVHSIVKFHYIFRSSHTPLRILWLFIELLYRIFCVVFTWFALGNYYISFVSLSRPNLNPHAQMVTRRRFLQMLWRTLRITSLESSRSTPSSTMFTFL